MQKLRTAPEGSSGAPDSTKAILPVRSASWLPSSEFSVSAPYPTKTISPSAPPAALWPKGSTSDGWLHDASPQVRHVLSPMATDCGKPKC